MFDVNDAPFERCLTDSKANRARLTDVFSESDDPDIGIVTRLSLISIADSLRPFSSVPTIKAEAPVMSLFQGEF